MKMNNAKKLLYHVNINNAKKNILRRYKWHHITLIFSEISKYTDVPFVSNITKVLLI
jgi:hypothetical protein